ncbi:TetR/AcrR family transcriptional regulator [Streptomyces luteolifulvus]|uniref:TetR/AcrR family transcriptional regulator n=1 Tax=Streptomyces luteolifulvus TaxID=2615112 RepID=UPI00177D631F|nr:TetR/AcrR family transcriptional regulator [Streptomyces luteolifulvus]
MPRPANPLVRERLLDAGLTLFHARGINAVGIKEITDTAGVPKGSFYSYYDSKNAFVAAVIDHCWSGVIGDHGLLLTDTSTPAVSRLLAFFEALAQEHAERGFELGCLLGNLALELTDDNGEARHRLADVMDQWSALIGACLEQARSEVDVTETTTTTELASMIIECWEGAVMRGRVDRSRVPFDRFLTVSLPRLLDTARVSV